MKRTVVAIFLLLFNSCIVAPKIIALKGAYPTPPIIQITDKSFDKVWDNVIDFFAQKGIPIKIIDRSSGLIVSDKASLPWSFEDKNGKLMTQSAYVVLQRVVDPSVGRSFMPQYVTGEWNVRVKTAEGKTSINVNLYNIEATYTQAYYSSYLHSYMAPVKADGRTTGVFEREFYYIVK